ncbi:MAG: hypothetical protein AAF938_06715 [Myxococcota bacterium]
MSGLRHASLGLLLLVGCGESGGERSLAVAHTVGFGTEMGEVDGRAITIGVDLDGQDTVERGSACFQEDYVAPDGRTGIDNSFASIFSLVEGVFQEGTVEGIIQGTINNGRLLLLFEVEGVDDWQNDPDVEVSVFLGDGRPVVGPDDRLVPNQTFDERLEVPRNRVSGRITDGVLETEAFDTTLPLTFFNVFFDLRLFNTQIRATVNELGEWEGVLAGGMPKEDLLDVSMQADAMQGIQVTPLVLTFLPGWTDLAFDEATGECNQISAVLSFRTTRAFLFDDAPPEGPAEEATESL